MPRMLRPRTLLLALAASAALPAAASAQADAPFTMGNEARGDGYYVNFVMTTPTDSGATGTITLKAGSHVVAKRSVSVESHDHDALPMLKKTAWGMKALKRHASVKVTAVAKVRTDAGPRTVRQRMTVYARGAKGYDGRYKGSAGLSFTVENGFVTALDKQTTAYCAASSMTTVAYLSLPYDAIGPVVKGNGAFAVEGHAGVGQTVKFTGKLHRNGKAAGYASYSESQMSVSDDGYYRTDYCFTGGKWTAKKQRK
jgi:hypothetical protein